MEAAVVTRFDEAPRYTDFVLPSHLGAHEEVVDVIAAGLHPGYVPKRAARTTPARTNFPGARHRWCRPDRRR